MAVAAVVERAGERVVMRASGWSSGGRDTLHCVGGECGEQGRRLGGAYLLYLGWF